MFFSGVFDRAKYKNKDLNYCYYSRGGNSLGGYYHMKLAEEDGQVFLTVSSKNAHYERESTSIYLCSRNDLNQIKELMIKGGLASASRNPLSSIQVLDGDTTSLSFEFSDDSEFRVSSTQKLSRRNHNYIGEIYSYMQSLMKGEPYASYMEKRQLSWPISMGYTLFINTADEVNEECYYSLAGIKDMTVDDQIHFQPDDGFKAESLQSKMDFEAGELAYDQQKNEIIIFRSSYSSPYPLLILGEIEDFDQNKQNLLDNLKSGQYAFYPQ